MSVTVVVTSSKEVFLRSFRDLERLGRRQTTRRTPTAARSDASPREGTAPADLVQAGGHLGSVGQEEAAVAATCRRRL